MASARDVGHATSSLGTVGKSRNSKILQIKQKLNSEEQMAKLTPLT